MTVNSSSKNKIDPNIFRAYDIRGIYPTEINENVVYKIGQALAQVLEPSKVVIGRDARLSSPALKKALIKGLTVAGVNVVDIGLSSTPMLYFGVNFLKGDGGVMISASHNPKEFNGLKLVREKAIPISGETGIGQIKDLVTNDKLLMTNDKKPQGKVILKDIKKDYIDFLTKDTKVRLPGLVAADAGNGMAGILLKNIFKKLKVDFIPLYFEPDCTFPNHEANPFKEETLNDLKKEMVKKHAFLGVAFDGDGDRVVFLDEKQKVVRGDFITALLAQRILKEKGPGKIIYDLRSLWTPREVIEKAGGKAVISRVGHSFIKEKMRQEKALFAGEMSGHFYFPFSFSDGLSYFESGIFTMIKIFEIISEKQEMISELVRPFQKYFHSEEINFKVKDKQTALKKIAGIYKNGKTSYLDGITVEYPDWWFNLRPSNTESLLRLNLEAKTEDLMKTKLKEIKSLLNKQ